MLGEPVGYLGCKHVLGELVASRVLVLGDFGPFQFNWEVNRFPLRNVAGTLPEVSWVRIKVVERVEFCKCVH